MSVLEAPTTKPPATPEQPAGAYRRGRSARLWHWTAGTGMALVLLTMMHIIAQHFVVHQKGGLRTYGEVLSYVANPVIFVLEAAFLIVVTIHAMLGVRSVLYDLDLSLKTKQRIDMGLRVIGTLTVSYGIALLVILAVRS